MNHDEQFEDTIDIAVIGMAGRWPSAQDVSAFWEQLRAGFEGITFFDDEALLNAGVAPDLLAHPRYVKAGSVLEDVELFDAAFFGYSPREAELLDPQQRIFLECAWQALEHAGYDAPEYPGLISVFAGCSLNTYLLRNIASQQGRGLPDMFQLIMGNDKDFLPTRVSYKLNLRGPSVSVQTACSTSLVAVHMACQSLLSYQSDIALAGGISITVPQVSGYMAQEGGILSPDGHCRSFDAEAQGTLNGNGAGIVVLKRLAEALEDGDTIYAVIKGSAINNDGANKIGYTAPSIEGQAAVIRAAQEFADVQPETISYIEAHGTATALGDPIEVAALTQAFRAQTDKNQFCLLGAVKSNVGHLDAAAGVTSLIKTVLALHHGQIPPTLHFKTPNPQLQLESSPFAINTELAEWPADQPIRRAGVSSFGIGGTNAHVILEEAPAIQDSAEAEGWQVLVLSARSRAALNATTANLARHLRANPTLNIADVAHTLQVGRHAFDMRRVVICRSLEEASEILAHRDSKQLFSGRVSAVSPATVWMFPGGGVHYPGMGRELYATQPEFKAAADRCFELLDPRLAAELREAMHAEEATPELQERLNTMLHSLLAIFITEYALAQQWLAWGVKPAALIGHSLGEYTAAHLAGSITLEAALRLVELRGRLMDQLAPGAMVNIALPEAEARALLTPELSLAALNGPEHSVVAGPAQAIEALERTLEEREIKYRRLPINVAAHSTMLAPIVAEFAALVRTITMRPAQIPYVSNVSGTWMTEADWANPEYWVAHLQSTVRFSDGIELLLRDHAHVFLEVGPGQTLSTLTRAQAGFTADRLVVQSMRHPQELQSDVVYALSALGRLWIAGVRIDWSRLAAGPRRRLPLPTYPFERRRFWIEQDFSDQTSAPAAEATPAADAAPAMEPAGYERPNLSAEYVAPSTKLEATVAQVWGEILGVPMIGIHDNFFELGGDSLIALQVATHLTERVQARVEVRSLFEAPTVAELARLIISVSEGGAAEEAKSSLVRLQHLGAGVPFFCVHPMGGMANVYSPLAQLLGTDRPFYGLQAHGMEYHEMARTTIEAMAQQYLRDIRAVQPQGPYLLGGWSMGGSIAFEMATALAQAGEQVSLLALIDTPAVLTGVSPDELSDLELVLAMLGPDATIPGVDIKEKETSPEGWNAVLEATREHLGLPPSYTLGQLRHLISTFRTHSRAAWDYRPGSYGGDVVVFRATGVADHYDAQLHEAYASADLGWGPYITGNVAVRSVDGTHNTLLEEPAIHDLARQLREVLTAAVADADQALSVAAS